MIAEVDALFASTEIEFLCRVGVEPLLQATRSAWLSVCVVVDDGEASSHRQTVLRKRLDADVAANFSLLPGDQTLLRIGELLKKDAPFAVTVEASLTSESWRTAASVHYLVQSAGCASPRDERERGLHVLSASSLQRRTDVLPRSAVAA